MITYRATLDVPRELAQRVASLLHAERRQRGTRTRSRALTCFWQAVLGLRWFRDRTDPTALGRDYDVSRATAYRYLDGAGYVIVDGKLFSANRCGEKTTSVKGDRIDAWYSGKAHEHAGNIQALCAPDGFPLWVCDVEPGSVHDLTAAREHVLGVLYWAASRLNLPALADGGYDGAGSPVTGVGMGTPAPASEHRTL